MRIAFAVVIVSILVCVTGRGAAAAGVVDRVKARGSVQCGGFERPGLAVPNSNTGAWEGLEVDVCRAVAAAVLGSADRISFHGYAGQAKTRLLAEGADDISFLTGTEIQANALSGRIIPGSAVFIESHALMVPADAGERQVADIPDGSGICFMSGSPLERSLPAYFGALGKFWRPVPFSEDGEMIDAYNVQRCHAIAHELTTLATVAEQRGINNLESRILREPITTYPVLAATGTSDGEWSAIVAWTVYTLIAADRPSGKWVLGGVNAMPAPLTELGLRKSWQAGVVTSVGSYRDMFERNLGAKSPLKLPPGFNAALITGGTLVSPVLE
jgi:general L-amino acid transport system substrate-binding protein